PVESVVSVGKNMADTIYGKRINSNDGSVLSDPVGVMTSLIPIDPTKTYYVTGLKNTCMSFFAWYDANGNYINRNGGAQRSYLAITPSDVPSNARYIRANQYGATSVDVVKDVKFMMSQSPSDPYVPYNKTTVLVPSAVKNLPDYGLGIVKSDGSIVANEVDFENGVYYHRVGQVDFKDLTFKPASEATFTYYYQFAEAKANSECICAKYTTSLDFTNDKIININQYHSLLLRDTSISSAGAVSTTNSGVKIVYERDSVETKPLTDFIRPLPVENGGTLTLVNEHNLDMPSVIKYKKEV
ncbi:MAG: hypothetical protein KBS66_07915, partial [Eubacterium sp.]|nr:hypothetical protein [Candidatus Colimonas fimequi]